MIPGSVLLPGDANGRPAVATAVQIRSTPVILGLAYDPIAVATALLSALDVHLAHSDTLVLQVTIGPRVAGRTMRRPVADPAQPIVQLLTQGVMQAPTPIQRSVSDRFAHHRFQTLIRIGAAADTSGRRRRLILGVFGAIGTARAAGVHLTLKRDAPEALNGPHLPRRWPLTLTPGELCGVLAWPLGDADLPGVPALHPRPLLPVRLPTPGGRAFGSTFLPGSGITVGVNATDSLMHMVAQGPTGSGKSNVLLLQIAADIAAGRALLVIDPKQQLIDDIIARAVPAERANDVVIVSLTDLHVPGINPLDAGDRDPDVLVDGLLAVFRAVFADGWGPRTEDIFMASLLTLARAGRAIGTPFTLVDLPRLLTEAAFRRRVIGHVAEEPTLAGFWATYDDHSPAAQAAMIAAPLNKLRRYLLRPAVRRLLDQPRPAFRLRDLFRDNKIVLVPLNEGLIGPITAQLVGSLIVAEAWNAAQERATEHEPMKRPGVVVVDECQNYVHLPTQIGDVLAQSRSYGVAWVLAHQTRSQLPPDLREGVDSNARNKVFFRLESAKDAAEAAKLTHGVLAPEDFQELPTRTAYVRVMTGGESSGWTMVSTLAPPPPTGLDSDIRRQSREQYGRQDAQLPTASETAPAPPAPSTAPIPPTSVGRKRRRPRANDDGGTA
ncbi:hypothetical protein QSJ19_02860 [Gordonia sp. ABSL11-1]|uniref:type IV secretory system conjugative DNA transfer family protein n=1 Tax=Gordonia sp. ABSL11-1 TaxID=3053924 RepID=UPI0025730CBC|nr:hypothetical protein [Gordonia sp. ABSL11-1]MDL9944541.1 hypothetical protein [Gordonia sp. ABSL11-1]